VLFRIELCVRLGERAPILPGHHYDINPHQRKDESGLKGKRILATFQTVVISNDFQDYGDAILDFSIMDGAIGSFF